MSLASEVNKKLRDREAQRSSFQDYLRTCSTLPSTESQESIAKCSATEIIAHLKAGRYSAIEVCITMCLRALEVSRLFHASADEMFLNAIAEAEAADELFRKGGPLPPLHGLPVSVKDSIAVAGTDSTCGIRSRVNAPYSYDAVLVKVLRENGAIIYVKSNIPQLLMLPESMNEIYGRAKNPFNIERSPGGSSGGEGVFVSTYSSYLGVGTDIGGSIRLPATFCGVCGFKGTPERTSNIGSIAAHPKGASGQANIIATSGPLARTVDDLKLYTSTIWNGQHKYDRIVPPVPYRASLSLPKPIRVGWFYDDGYFGSCDAAHRAVDIARLALAALPAFELVPFKVPNSSEMARLFFSILNADDAMGTQIEGLGGDDLIVEYQGSYKASLLSRERRVEIAEKLNQRNEKRKAQLVLWTGTLSVKEYWAVVRDLHIYRRTFVEELRRLNIHALLNPTSALPAYPHGGSAALSPAMTSTAIYNVLHFPAGTIPVTKVREDENCFNFDVVNDSYTKVAQAQMKNSTGMPIGVQIATPPWQDELALEIMGQLENALSEDKEVGLPFISKV